ncbi:unnamed protein product [Toxocara canis]|uniref:Uncharacterized protein n=1 Tax=Toxocara canis TaxID=6265 RepID=A0A183UL97_TOXCA|nr:unnamed protein product [Toxocara canis]
MRRRIAHGADERRSTLLHANARCGAQSCSSEVDGRACIAHILHVPSNSSTSFSGPYAFSAPIPSTLAAVPTSFNIRQRIR